MLRALTLCLLFGLSATVLQADDVIHAKDGRRLKGTIVHQDEKVVKLKMRFGTLTIKRDEIDRIERGGGKGAGSGSGVVAAPGGKETHRSPFIGYEITKPDRNWVFKKMAPAPLVDVMVYHTRLQAELRVGVDDVGKMAIEAGNVDAYAAGTRRGLQQLNTGVKVTLKELTTFAGKPAIHLKYEGVSKFTKKHKVFDELLFDAKGRRYQILCEVPAENAEKAAKDLESIRASFTFIQAKEREGKRFYNFDLLYEVDVPDGGSLTKTGPAKALVKTKSGAELTILVTPQIEGKTARDLGKEHEATLGSLPGFALGSNVTANLLGALCASISYTTAKGEHNDLVLWQNRKRYTLQKRWAKGSTGKRELDEVLKTFLIRPDLTSSTSISEGRKARDHAHKGTMASLSNNAAVAIAEYTRAIELFPRFALAHNNLAISLGKVNERDKAFYHSQKAYKLYAENALYKNNHGIALTNKAYALLGKKEYKKAISAIERARRVNPKDKRLIGWLASAHYYVGISKMNARSYSSAMVSLRKAIKLQPKEGKYKDALANCYYNTAIGYWNKRQYSRCLSPLKKALKIAPNHGGARKMLEQVKQQMKGK